MKNFKTYKNFSVDKSITEKFMDSQIDQIAQKEFGMDYDQLGKGEKEWVRDEIDNMTESVNEADINKLHKPFVDDIYKAVGVIDKILSKNKPPKVPTDIWSKLYGLAGDMTEWADELLTLKESVTEAAPRITNSKETEALLELRDRVANSSKGGSSRYSKEFDKAKTTALRAIEQMLTYTKIGV